VLPVLLLWSMAGCTYWPTNIQMVGTSSVVKCPPLNCKVGCSMHVHWVNCRSTPWAKVFT